MDAGLGWSGADRQRPWHVRLADVGLAVVLAGVLFPASARAIWDSSWPSWLEMVGLSTIVLGHAALAVRRAMPRLTFAVAGLVVLFLVAAPALDLGRGHSQAFSAALVPSVLVFPVALYTVAAWCSDRTSLTALGLSILGAVIVLARLWGSSYLTVTQPGLAASDDPVQSWQLFLALAVVAMVFLPWAFGRYRHLRVLYVAALEERARHVEAERAAEARRAVEEERRRIAREMHDVVAHSLSVLVSQAEGGRMMAAKDPGITVPVLDTIARTGREAMHDMGRVLQVLDRPDDDGADPEPPQPGLAQLPGLVAQLRQAGLTVRLQESGVPRRLSGSAELAVYRVVQEALTNVLKHAGPRAATDVTQAWEDSALEIRIRNQVVEPHESMGGTGRGLTGMEQRLSVLGGSLRVDRTGDRFEVRARVPLVEEG